MRKIYVYLAISLFAITHSHDSCKAFSRKRMEKIKAKKRALAKKRRRKKRIRLFTEIVIFGLTTLLVAIKSYYYLRKDSVAFFIQMAGKGIDKVNADIKTHIPKLDKQLTLQYLREQRYTVNKFKLKNRKEFHVALSGHFKNKKLNGPASKLYRELRSRIQDKARQGRTSA